MLTRRDGIVAFVAATLTATVAWAAQAPAKPLLPSSVFDWAKMKVQGTTVGERRAIFDAKTVTLDRLECHATTVNPGESAHAPHKHPEEELMVIKEGTVEIMQNGATTVVGPGSVIFHTSNDLHGLKNVGDKPASYVVLKWYTPAVPAKTE